MANSTKVKDEVSTELKELLTEKTNKENKKGKHFEIVQKIIDLEKHFNEIDSYFEEISSLQSQNDEFISDLLHYVEEKEFTPTSALKFLNLLKEKRLKRRKLKYDWEIKQLFCSGRSRFATDNQREIFMASIYKKEKELSAKYKPRQISFEEIDEMLVSKRGRKKKVGGD